MNNGSGAVAIVAIVVLVGVGLFFMVPALKGKSSTGVNTPSSVDVNLNTK